MIRTSFPTGTATDRKSSTIVASGNVNKTEVVEIPSTNQTMNDSSQTRNTTSQSNSTEVVEN